MIEKVKKFVSEVVVELKKVAWTTRQELIDSTWLVIISSALLGIYIATSDFVLARIVSTIIK